MKEVAVKFVSKVVEGGDADFVAVVIENRKRDKRVNKVNMGGVKGKDVTGVIWDFEGIYFFRKGSGS